MRLAPALLALFLAAPASCSDAVETPGLDHPSVTLDMRVDVSETPSEYYATVNEGLDRMTGSLVIGNLSHTLNLRRTP